jgi:ribosomal protein S12 methylthiotransferase
MLGSFGLDNYRAVTEAEGADLLVVNTCGFIGPAREASINAILELAEVKGRNPGSKLVVTGCLTQLFADELAKELPEVDLFVGSGDATRIAELVRTMREGDAQDAPVPRIQVGKAGTLYDPDSARIHMGPSHSAYIKIAEGCSQRCTFCIIPRLRGKAKSRPIESIVAEVTNLAQQGVREFNVIAQDLTHYGDDLKDEGLSSLTHLLDALSQVKDARWIRLMYCYPHGFGDALLEHLNGPGPVVPYMDMPLQHIDDEVLKSMARRVPESETRALMDHIREQVPDIFLRTTFLVGFPGETEEQFERLCSFASDFQFDHSGAFAYSYEEHTLSGKRSDQVASDTGERRADQLGELLRQASSEQAQNRVGQIVEAVVEGLSEVEGVYTGRHWGQAPEIDGETNLHWSGTPLKAGTFVRAQIRQSVELDLEAEVLEVLELPAS